MDNDKIREKLLELRKEIVTLEWDEKRNQLNPGKKVYFEALKKEYSETEAKLKSINLEENKEEEKDVGKEDELLAGL